MINFNSCPLSQLLNFIQSASDASLRPHIGAALRCLYWRYSFNVARENFNFQVQVCDFIQCGGIQLLVSMICTTLEPYGLKKPCEWSMLDVPLNSPWIPVSSSGIVEKDIREYYYQDYARLFNHPVLDSTFRLPASALSYEALRPIEEHEEQVTLRQLALEIISEMTNYKEYRVALGDLEGTIPSLMALFQLMTESRIHRNYFLFREERFDRDSSIFMLDRMINIFANLAFDGNKAFMTEDRQRFRIQNSMASRGGSRRRDRSIIPRHTDNSGRVVTPDNSQSIKKKNNRKGRMDATHLLVSFMLNELGPWMLLACETVHTCPHTLRNIARFYCNTLFHAHDRVLIRLAEYEPISRLLDLSHKLKKLIQENPAMNQEQVGIQAVDLTLVNMSQRYHRLYIHSRQQVWKFEDELNRMEIYRAGG